MFDKNTKAFADPQYDSPGFTVQFTGTIFKAITVAISSICALVCAICKAITVLVIAVCALLCAIIGLLVALLRWLTAKIPIPTKENPGFDQIGLKMDIDGKGDTVAAHSQYGKQGRYGCQVILHDDHFGP